MKNGISFSWLHARVDSREASCCCTEYFFLLPDGGIFGQKQKHMHRDVEVFEEMIGIARIDLR